MNNNARKDRVQLQSIDIGGRPLPSIARPKPR